MRGPDWHILSIFLSQENHQGLVQETELEAFLHFFLGYSQGSWTAITDRSITFNVGKEL